MAEKKKMSGIVIVMAIFFVGALIFFIVSITGGDGTRQTSSSRSRAVTASTEQVDRIEYGLKDGYSISGMKTIRSKDFDNVYFVGGIVTRERSGNETIGIWATGGKTDISMSFSVNDHATACSDYPKGQTSMSDDGARELYNHLNATLK